MENLKMKSKILYTTAILVMALTVFAVVFADSNSIYKFKAVGFLGGNESTDFFTGENQEFEHFYDKTAYLTYLTGDMQSLAGNTAPRRITSIDGKIKVPIYCLDGTLEFPTKSDNSYKKLGELAKVEKINTKNGEKTLTDVQKSKLLWLFDNVYMRGEEPKEQRTEYKRQFVEKIIKFGQTSQMSDIIFKQNVRAHHAYLTDDDYEVITQWAIWYVVNGKKDFAYENTYLVKNENEKVLGHPKRVELRKKLFNKLILMLDSINTYKPAEIKENIAFLDNETNKIKYDRLQDGKYLIKNLSLNIKEEAKDLIKSLNVYYLNADGTFGAKIPEARMDIFINNDYTKPQGGRLVDLIKTNTVAIKINENKIKDAKGIALELEYTSKELNTTVFVPEDANKNILQPLIAIERKKKPARSTMLIKFKEEKKISDFVLRKNIESIDNVEPQISRRPVLDIRNLKNELNPNGQKTTAEYMHPKNPLMVKKGSVIKYKFSIYNELTKTGEVSQIADKLPKGLKLKQNSQINTFYKWKQVNDNILVTDFLKGTQIPGMTLSGTTLNIKKAELLLELEVENDAEEGKVLTNIASIIEQTPAEDRDSAFNNIVYPSDLSGYKGHGENKAELSDKNYHYKGQEDDDDFEKVQVEVTPPTPEPVKEIDLALRKSIIAVNGNMLSNEKLRLPEIEGGDFKNNALKFGSQNNTTLKYKHRKNPVEVETGNIIRYRINVYNEGDVNAKALKIHDKLPEHLEYIENSEINKKYGWKKISNDIVETEYTKNTELQLLDNLENLTNGKSNTFVEIELRVKENATANIVQTNIASIIEQMPVGDRDSNVNNVNYPSDMPGYKGNSNNKAELSDKNYHYKGQEDDDDFEKVIIKEKPVIPEPNKEVDLTLRKSIIAVNGNVLSNEELRLPKIEGGDFKNNALKFGSQNNTTLKYKHKKNPVEVKTGNIIRYRINVYNEGDVNAKALKIHDKLPEYLEYIENSEINKKYGWKKISNDIVETEYTKNTELQLLDNLENLTNGKSNTFVEIELKVKENAKADIVQTNIASIIEQMPVGDRDSNVNNVNYPSDMPGYKGNSSNKSDLSDKNYHYKGQEDDDDFEKVIIKKEPVVPEPKKEFDLALRKYITSINKKVPEIIREPKVDVSPLLSGGTTAKYIHPKNPLMVKDEDIVIYTLRIYNEAETAGIVEEVSEYLPESLGFIKDHEINKKYGWKLIGNGKEENGIVLGKGLKLVTNYLNPELNEKEKLDLFLKNIYPEKNKDKIIPAFNKQTKQISYKELQIAVKVLKGNNLKNVAEISKDYNHEKVKDRDSVPNNVKIEGYTQNQEDDDDFEPLVKENKPKEFDLALRKFITHIGSKDGKRKEDHTSRAPKVDINPLLSGGKTAKYIHPKEPLLVAPEDRIEYTLRVYNEGEIDGYAEIIGDNIPKNLEFIPDDPLNIQYGWILKGERIETDYLSKAKSEANIIKAFDPINKKLDYKEVKVAFRISKEYKPKDGIIKNIAEIIKDFNKENIKDRDSIPNNNNPKEDDEDYDQVKPTYFDLALRKIVSKIIVLENGKVAKEIATNHKYEDSPEKIAKYEIDKKKFDITTIKWEYKIRVTNEGEIPGMVKEISDYLPEGTYFDKSDNLNWEIKNNNTITTKELENRILNPKESAEVTVVLRWKKDAKNMGVKTNWAEISKDYNKYGIKDIDSVPGNKRPHEDDIDDAPVALAISTGREKSYLAIILIFTTILAVIVAIAKIYINMKEANQIYTQMKNKLNLKNKNRLIK